GGRATEAAAILRCSCFAQLQPAHGAQEAAGTFPEPELAQGMTGIVVGDHAFKACAYILSLRHLHEKLRKFEDFRSQSVGGLQRLCILSEDFGVVPPHHRRARAGWADDIVATLEHLQEMPADQAGFPPKAAVEGGLATACLRFRKIDFIPQALQHPRHRQANLWKKLIYETGDKE